jgi:hypothetical protein
MKYFFLLFFSFKTILFSSSVIINIDSKFNIPAEFRNIIERNLDDYKYKLVEMVETDSLDVEIKKSEINCKKNDCYLSLGKKFKADYLLDIHINKIFDVYTSKYKVKISLIDLKTIEKIKKIFYYRHKFSDVENLGFFAEKIMVKFFEEVNKSRIKKKEEIINKVPKQLTKKDILSMIREIYPEVKKCGVDKKYSGTVNVRFKINNNGTISDIDFISKNVDIVKNCIYESIKKMKSKEFRGKPMIINFPLKLD